MWNFFLLFEKNVVGELNVLVLTFRTRLLSWNAQKKKHLLRKCDFRGEKAHLASAHHSERRLLLNLIEKSTFSITFTFSQSPSVWNSWRWSFRSFFLKCFGERCVLVVTSSANYFELHKQVNKVRTKTSFPQHFVKRRKKISVHSMLT